MYVYEGYRIPEQAHEITMFKPEGSPSAYAVLVCDKEPNRVMKTPYWDEDIDYGDVTMDQFIRTARYMVDGTLMFLTTGVKKPMPSMIVRTV